MSGQLRSALIIGIQGIRARKLRTLLSMVSLFLGVLAVVAVQAGAEIGERALLSNVELQVGIDGTRQMYIPTNDTSLPVIMDTFAGRTDAVAMTSVQAKIGEPGVTPVNPGGSPFDQNWGGGRAFGPPVVMCDQMGNCTEMPGGPSQPEPPGQAIELRVVAMTGDVRQFRPYRHQSGEWLDFTGPPQLAPRLVLNREAAKGFNRYRVPAEMTIQGSPKNPTPRLIGVVEDGQMQPVAYVRMDELRNWLPDSGLLNGGVEAMLAPNLTDTEQILMARLEALGVNRNDIYINTIESRQSAEESLALMRIIFLSMAGLVLLIGVAGILNVGLATVGERVEEFALRRAVGTPRVLLAGIVLAETLLTGLLTAAAAVGVGALVLNIVGAFVQGRGPLPQDLSFPWQAAVAGVVAGLIAGILGGLVPAIRAARIPIATVMRA